ncbi:GNAT family N-acetyltransferase [Paenibacillus thiaminolyticus]|uniref:GNAT family N-acetyltransferase n=1 Tax=Paenibacillus thiaminolyticus TaxID=49283 RepID=UPI002873D647|nr:GNAT family N-acetyltransferase [Paenibacillus thiaminolyticus]
MIIRAGWQGALQSRYHTRTLHFQVWRLYRLGFQIDKSYQGKGYGKLALRRIIDFIRENHPLCRLISLTVEQDNKAAQRLYESIGFVNQQENNQDGEVIYKLFLA